MHSLWNALNRISLIKQILVGLIIGLGLRPGLRCLEPQTGRSRIEHQRCHHPVSYRYLFSGFLRRHDQFRLPADAAARRIGCQQ